MMRLKWIKRVALLTLTLFAWTIFAPVEQVLATDGTGGAFNADQFEDDDDGTNWVLTLIAAGAGVALLVLLDRGARDTESSTVDDRLERRKAREAAEERRKKLEQEQSDTTETSDEQSSLESNLSERYLAAPANPVLGLYFDMDRDAGYTPDGRAYGNGMLEQTVSLGLKLSF